MKRFIKSLAVVLAFITTFISVGISVSADTGPKSYVDVTIVGESSGMYMTLLSKESVCGPWSNKQKFYEDEDTTIHQKFFSYNDKDGYYYLKYYKDVSNKSFRWSYMPPDTFKILIYDSNNDTFITDDVVYNCYAFESIYTLTLTDASFTVTSDSHIGRAVLNFIIRLTICLAIEMAFAVIFRFKRMEYIVILLVNSGTQIILNVLLTLFIYYDGYQLMALIPFYILSEILVLLIESILYLIFISKVDNKYGYRLMNPAIITIYTFVANVVSLGLGFFLLANLSWLTI